LIKDLEDEKERYRQENELLRSESEKYAEKVSSKEEGRRKEIYERWTGYFDKFIIDQKAVRDVVKFSRKELICVEKSLWELHNTKDPRALSRGKIKGTTEDFDYMAVSFPDGFPTRILYEVLSNQKKTVRILEVYKHNEKKYQ
jgi:hypothetical protein